jgi:predicted pyridoxine 5'-phosphate oxidase superfamily flavin-nucleotide-binding protein
MKTFAEVAFTPAVQAAQEHYGSRTARKGVAPQGLSPVEAEFLAAADSFYLATVGETGWPYIQHRGGPQGFLKTLSPTRIAFADFRGNRQYVSVGNVSKDDRASMIVVDYVNRRRLKLLGRLRFHDIGAADAALAAVADLPGYPARVERVAVLDVEALDWNCPQHITRRS